MEEYRCGYKPHEGNHDAVRMRIADNMPRWKRDGLKVYVPNAFPGLSKKESESAVLHGFQTWFRYIRMTVELVRDGEHTGAVPDVVVDVGGRGDGFDGPGGVLAWCELPPGNDRQIMCKVDPSERWSLGTMANGVVDIVRVLMHEFGHGLGLDHSTRRTALMYPTVSQTISEPTMDDDIPRLWALYPEDVIRPGEPIPVPTVPPVVPDKPTVDIVVSTSQPIMIRVNGQVLSL